jgi:uncharacterized protein (TIGR03435 family)
MRSKELLAGIAFMFGAVTSAGGQTPLQFDAATIKLDQRGPGERGMKGGPGTKMPGRVTWRKVWLRDLLATALDVDPSNVSGPEWISRNGAQLYAFAATMPVDTNRHDFELMLQGFLMEQFRIKLHHEPRMFPAYELVVAPGGAKLKNSADPNAPDNPVWTANDKIGSDGFPVFSGHGKRLAPMPGFRGRFQAFTMPEFAEYLINWVTPQADRTRYVLDKTGLAGVYDFTLKFDEGDRAIVLGPAAQSAPGAPGETEPGSGLPNIFKALERQLGLNLVKVKDIPKDTIVIDQAERIPVGN